MSIRRMMLFTLGGFFKSIISLFKTRVLNDGGTFEAETKLENQLNTLGSTLFDSASLVITPNGVKTSKLYSIKPNDGTGDLTVIRNTSATKIDENGNIVNVPANVARIDYTTGSPAILVEPQRTNSIRNSTMQGAVVGTPGTLPTNWSVSYPSGLTTTVVGLGVEKGINYIDLKISGTANSTVYLYRMQSEASVIVSLNQSWTISTYFKKIQNNLPSGFAFNIVGRPSSLGYSETIAGNYIQNTMTTELLRYTASGVVSNTNTVYADTTVRFDTVIGQTYDFTFRVAAPQLELGSNATSYIPTTTATVTRNADIISKSGINNLIGQTEGTLFLDASSFNFLGTGVGERISFTDGTFNNRVSIDLQSTTTVSLVASNSTLGLTGVITSTNGLISPNNRFKIAIAYNGINSVLYINGVAFTTITGTIPTFTGQLNKFEFNQGNGSRPFYGKINSVLSFKTRLSNLELQQLTTL